MPEIKHNFTGGKMNKDLDERLVPNGQYLDALNIQISTSEAADVGSVQNILGNTMVSPNSQPNIIGLLGKATCVGTVVDEKNDAFYWLTCETVENKFDGTKPDIIVKNMILQYKDNLITPVFVDIQDFAIPGSGLMFGPDANGLTNVYLQPGAALGLLTPGMVIDEIWGDPDNDGIYDNLGFGGEVTFVDYTNGYATININFQEVLDEIFQGQIPQFPFSVIASRFQENVLNFKPDILITGINIIDDMLFWTDGHYDSDGNLIGSEPKKINIPRSIEGTDATGTIHTNFINETLNTSVPAQEQHITVIKKAPKYAPEMRLESIKPSAATMGVFEASFEDTVNNPGELLIPGDSLLGVPVRHSIWNNLTPFNTYNNTDFQFGDIVAIELGPNIDTDIRFPLNDPIVTAKVIATYVSSIPDSDGVFTTNLDLEIISISSETPIHPTEYLIDLKVDNTDAILKFKFPKFAIRYKYQDNEYSAFSPFTQVAFVPLSWDYQPKKGRNVGMQNHLKRVILSNFRPLNIPAGVIQIDILYKESGSSNVYIVDQIKPNDGTAKWMLNSYWITSEVIHAAVEENQILRHYDNVPKIARSQEVTGSRIVYGNYKQNYTAKANHSKPLFNLSLKPHSLTQDGSRIYPFHEFPYEWDHKSMAPLKSIKSLREYQFGVVYEDKYGRQSPVMTSDNATIKVPKSESGNTNLIDVQIVSDPPPWAEHFRFFIKEPSTEYYNLSMDRWYDAEDGNIWLTFPSLDRNKLSEESTIILKKNIDSNTAIVDTSEYKVIAIENEAPDFVKNTKISYGIEAVGTGTSGQDLIGSNPPLPSMNKIYINPTILTNIESSLIHAFDDWQKADIAQKRQWLRFRKVTTPQSYSKWYEIIALDDYTDSAGNVSTDPRLLQIHGLFGDDISFMDNGTGGFCEGASIEIARSVQTPYAAFDGRFFVKILKDLALEQSILEYQYDGGYSTVGILNPLFLRYDGEHHSETAFTNYNISGNHDIGNGGLSGPFQVFGNTPESGGWTRTSSQLNPAEDDYGLYAPSGSLFVGDTTEYTTAQSFMDPRWGDFIDGTGATWAYSRKISENWSQGEDSNADPTTKHRYPKSYPYMLGAYQPQCGGCYDLGTTTPNFAAYFTNYIGRAGSFWKNFDDWFIDMEPTINFPANSWDNGVEKYYELDNGSSASPDPNANNGIRNSINTPGVGARVGSKRIDISYTGADYTGGPVDFQNIQNKTIHDFITSLEPTFQFNGDPGMINYKIVDYRIVTDIKNICDDCFCDFDGVATHFSAAWPYGCTSSATQEGDGQQAGIWRVRYELLLDQVIGTTVQDEGIITPEEYVLAGGTPDETFNHNAAGNGQNSGQICCNGTPVYARKWTFYPLDYSVIPIVPDPQYPNYYNFGQTPGCYSSGSWTTMNSCPETHGAYYDTTDNGAIGFPHNNTIIDSNTWTNKDGSTRFGYIPTTHARALDSSVVKIHPEDISFGNTIPIQGTGDTAFYAASEKISSSWLLQELWGSAGYGQAEFEMAKNPAIWETIPPDPVDLELYYEVSQSYPIDLMRRGDNYVITPPGTLVTCYNCATGIIQSGTTIDYWLPDTNTMGLTINHNNDIIEGDIIKLTNPIDGSYITVTVSEDTTNTSEIKILRNIYNSNFGLSWHNCFSFGNGVESDRISDTFNSDVMGKGVKASTVLKKDYEEEHRKYGLIYSGLYNSTSGINNLNQFITAEKITKDINPIYGSIQKLHTRDTDLVTLCEDKVLKILANKDAVFNADGNIQLTATGNVLGQTVPFIGEYGISKNPESFASESYRAYFTDKVRGAVMRLSRDGLTAISDHGMRDWFNENLTEGSGIRGSYDDNKDEYNLTIKNYTITFREDVKGWVSFKSFIPEDSISCANNYYSFKEGLVWKHHAKNVDRNNFYGDENPSTIQVYLNDFPSIVKSFETINYEGTQSRVIANLQDNDYYNLSNIPGWFVESITTDKESGSVDEFIEKEGKWFNYIKGENISVNNNNQIVVNNDGSSSFDQSSFAVQGIGILNSPIVSLTTFGCTDPTQSNYDADANIPCDGNNIGCFVPNCTGPGNNECCQPNVFGCTDPTADNYNAAVNNDDGSCLWTGCTCEPAASYPNGCINTTDFTNAYAYNGGTTIIDDGSCIAANPGCTDCGSYWESLNSGQFCDGNSPSAFIGSFNYDPTANIPCCTVCDGSDDNDCCEDVVYGCMEESAFNTSTNNPPPNVDPGYCQWFGCTNPLSQYYHLGVNHGPNQGNPWPSEALNYVPYNNSGAYGMIDDGSCLDVGCTDGGQGAFDVNGDAIPSLWPNYPAANWLPTAIIDDGSCYWPTGCGVSYADNYDAGVPPGSPGWDDGCDIGGCNNSSAMNWDCATNVNPGSLIPCNDNVTYNDGTCVFNISGCTDPTACNYDASANTDDGSCEFVSCAGCTDPTATNYSVNYSIPCGDGSDATDYGHTCCVYNVTGCWDATACNFYPDFNTWPPVDNNGNLLPGTWIGVNDGTCSYTGCTDPTALNYSACATIDDASCVYSPVPGCTDSNACNYNAAANTDDGTCLYGFNSLTIGDPNAVDVNGNPIVLPQPLYYYTTANAYSPTASTKHYVTPTGNYPVDAIDERDIALSITHGLQDVSTTSWSMGDEIVIELYKKDYSVNQWVLEYDRGIDMATHWVSWETETNGAVFGDRINNVPEPWGPNSNHANNYAFDIYHSQSQFQEYRVDVYSVKDGVEYGKVGGTYPNCGISQMFSFTPVEIQYHPAAILGCTDDQACNYDPTANIDDGSCTYTTVVYWYNPDPGNQGCEDCAAPGTVCQSGLVECPTNAWGNMDFWSTGDAVTNESIFMDQTICNNNTGSA